MAPLCPAHAPPAPHAPGSALPPAPRGQDLDDRTPVSTERFRAGLHDMARSPAACTAELGSLKGRRKAARFILTELCLHLLLREEEGEKESERERERG